MRSPVTVPTEGLPVGVLTRWVSLRDTGTKGTKPGTREEINWPTLFYEFLVPVHAKGPTLLPPDKDGKRKAGPGKDRLPGWSPATFADDQRLLVKCERVYALGLDFDKGTPLDGAAGLFGAFGFLHTTWKHMAPDPRCRVILPYSRPVTAEEHGRIYSWAIARAAGGGVVLDSAPRDPSRLWYVPGIGEDGTYETRNLDGPVFDPDAVLRELDELAAVAVVAPPLPLASSPPTGPQRRTDRASVLRRASAYTREMPASVDGDNGSILLLKAAVALAWRFELGESEALDVLRTEFNPRCRGPWSEEELAHAVDSALKDPPPGKSRPPRGDLLNAPLPDRGRQLVQVVPMSKGSPVRAMKPTPTPEVIDAADADGDPDADADDDGPLHNLAARAKTDPSILHRGAVLDALTDLYCGDMGRFEIIRDELKRARVSYVTMISAVVARRNARDAEAKRKQVEKILVDRPAWQGKLSTNAAAQISPTGANVATILREDERWRGVLRYNEFRGAMETTRQPPWHDDDAPGTAWVAGAEWSDADDTRAANWLARTYNIVVNERVVAAEIAVAAQGASYHPLRDCLSALRWDSTPRLATWLTTYLGATEPPEAQGAPYLASVGTWWMISAVARAFEPGCQADYMLILEGDQGVGKTAAVRALVPDIEWVLTLSQDAGSLESQRALRGRWIIELGELDALSRADIARVKRFVSETADPYRDPFARRMLKWPRQCTFVGTHNPGLVGYLRDPTGARRFWPVPCGSVCDVAGVARDRDQLWAEAVHRFQAKETWWPPRTGAVAEALERVQGDRAEDDVWDGKVADYLARKRDEWNASDALREARGVAPVARGITTADILSALEVETARQDRGMQSRVGAIVARLRNPRWTSVRRGDASRTRVYVPADVQPVQPGGGRGWTPQTLEHKAPPNPSNPSNQWLYIGGEGVPLEGGGGDALPPSS